MITRIKNNGYVTFVVDTFNSIIFAPSDFSITKITNVEPPLFSGLKIVNQNKIEGITHSIVNSYVEFKISGYIKVGFIEIFVKDFFTIRMRSLCNLNYCGDPSTNPDHGKITSMKNTTRWRTSTLLSMARKGRRLR